VPRRASDPSGTELAKTSLARPGAAVMQKPEGEDGQQLHQSPRYDSSRYLSKPVRFPKGERLAVLIYVNIEHVPFGSTAWRMRSIRDAAFSPDILITAGVTTATASDCGASWMRWISTASAYRQTSTVTCAVSIRRSSRKAMQTMGMGGARR